MDFPPYHELVRNQLMIRLLRTENAVIDRWWRYRDVRSSYWRIYVSNRDGAGVAVDGKMHPARPRQILFIPTGVCFTCKCSRPVELLSIHFDVLGISPAAMRRFFSAPISLPTSDLFEALRANCRLDDDPTLLCNVKALVYLAMGRLVQPILRDTDGDLSMLQDSGRVTPAVRYIEEHLAGDLDTRHLADLCHLSRDHFIRVFRQHVGATPAQYVITRRVAVAMQRLLFTADSIERIADSTGFPDRFYFSRVFAKRTGQSPAAYRRQTRI